MGIAKMADLFGMYKTIKTPSNPKAQSLENFQAQKWYLKQEKSIPKHVKQDLSIRQKGYKAFKKRDEVRTKAREIMADQKKAAELDLTNPNKTLKQIVKENYDKGYVGNQLWERISNSSIKSIQIVNFQIQLQMISHYLFFSGVLVR
jgi:hypothetical protein